MKERNKKLVISLLAKMSLLNYNKEKFIDFIQNYTVSGFNEFDSWTQFILLGMINDVTSRFSSKKRKIANNCILLANILLERPVTISEDFCEDGILPFGISKERIIKEGSAILDSFKKMRTHI